MSNVELMTRSADVIRGVSAGEIFQPMHMVARRNLVIEAMKSVMRDGVHYGTIPGTPKPSLYKPGAELLFSMFRIAASIGRTDEERATTHDGSLDEVRYRVEMIATAADGTVLGTSIGVCSSSEEKYRWRAPVCAEEWEETAPDRRREAWKRKRGEATKIKQIRMQAADVENTIFQMAAKRGAVALCRMVTACSDIFSSGIEDLPEEFIEASVATAEDSAPHISEPRRKSEAKPAEDVPPPSGGITVSKAEWVKDGKSEKGPWSLYSVVLSDGHSYKTFSETDYGTALHAAQNGLSVIHEWKPGRKEGDRNLVSIAIVEPPEAE